MLEIGAHHCAALLGFQVFKLVRLTPKVERKFPSLVGLKESPVVIATGPGIETPSFCGNDAGRNECGNDG